jgi:hypothetical protein
MQTPGGGKHSYQVRRESRVNGQIYVQVRAGKWQQVLKFIVIKKKIFPQDSSLQSVHFHQHQVG